MSSNGELACYLERCLQGGQHTVANVKGVHWKSLAVAYHQLAPHMHMLNRGTRPQSKFRRQLKDVHVS